MRPAIATIAPRVWGIRAKSTTMPSNTSRSEYRSMTESRKAPNGVTWPETRASAPSKKSQRPATISRSPAARVRPAENALAARKLTPRPMTVRWLGGGAAGTGHGPPGRSTRGCARDNAPASSDGLRERLLERRAGALERLRVLDLPPLAVLHVKGVERLVDLGRDPRAHDVEPEPGERLRDEVEEPEPVRTLHLDHRGGVRALVVEGELRRAARARRLAPGGAAPGAPRGTGLHAW